MAKTPKDDKKINIQPPVEHQETEIQPEGDATQVFTLGDEAESTIQETISRSEAFLNNNGKLLLGVLAGLLVAFGIYYYYSKIYLPSKENEAIDAMYQAEYFFGVDSLDKALKGAKGSFSGFESLADEFSGTKAANLASYYAGICHLKKGNYQKAIDYLEDFSSDDVMVAAVAKGATGEAYFELGQKEKALKYYEEAASTNKNDITAPQYLLRSGEVSELLGKKEEATKFYQRIKDEYPASVITVDVDKYIARSSSK